jgi:hypothetical protein
MLASYEGSRAGLHSSAVGGGGQNVKRIKFRAAVWFIGTRV